MKLNKLYLFAGIIVLISILYFTSITSPLENIIIKILNPVLGNLYSSSSDINALYREKTDKRDLLNEIQQLKIKNNKLTQSNIQLKILKDENKILRKYLNFIEKDKFNYVLSNIISRSNFLTIENQKKIIIDKGKNEGITKGLAVLNNDGIIIGKITNTKNNSSEVCLITDKNCKFAASIQNNDHTAGIIFGELEITAKMEFIPQTEKLTLGDIVVTSGLEENIPRGLIIGKIIKIHQEDNEVWQNASIEPTIDANDLSIVLVLLPNNKK